MSILKDLYYGDVSVFSRAIKKGSRYDQLTHSIVEKEDVLLETLSPKEKELYEAIGDMQSDRRCIAETETFVSGFRLGAQIMMEILTEPDRQLI